MEVIVAHLKSNLIKMLFIVLITYLIPMADLYAERGCCSRHGGVASCSFTTGYLMCRDGTQSHSCRCKAGYRTKPATKTKEYKKSEPSSITNTIFGTGAGTATKQKPASSTRGCCRGHGGVSGCDKKTGYLRCKDRSISLTCKCS